ncbi:NACHT domain-containing protein [Nodosilinea sp. FACHB-131]|uniref:NACHT domain-containing protein n=1 Tax=Cyanophyceae TaxID=3028117 RepID=UPI0016860F76|nr:NACHT domain-containing protein [Nodosilinea sp. FACHB-131]MBD1873806.1 NACHT domain-containing protein [Nodosilinea sp. FACHB-131]
MALLESAIGGIAATVIETAIKTGGAVASQIKGAYNETQAKQRALEAAQNYVQRYNQRHCQVKVLPGLMKEPLPLEDIYTAVKLLDDQSIRYFAGLNDLEENYRTKGKRSFWFGEPPRQDGIQIANAEQYLMVLGGPGIGKSTFLRKIGLEALRKNGQIQRACIPVLIDLKELRDEAIDLKQKIATEFATCGFPEAEAFTEASLAQGKLLVLLDGLDEVPTQNLNRVVEHIEKFVDAHSSNAFVASCRIAAYRGSHGTCFKRFTDVTLAEFDDEQIEQFIHRWFRSDLDLESSTADKYWQLLQKDENRATKELAQTPLLLTFLCLVYDRQQMLPTQRSALYGKALDILLSEWSAQKRLEQDPIYEGFHPDLEKVLLAQIAYDSFEQDQLFFLKDDIIRRISEFLADTLDAPKHLDGASVLRAIERQQGILVERATDIYSFSHLTLQEYLTAFHIKEEGLETKLVARHPTDERWREVFLLVAGLMGNKAIEFLTAIGAKAQKYIEIHPNLVAFIQWANTSTVDSKEQFNPIAKRATAIVIASANARDRVSARHSAIAIAIASASASASAIARDIASAIASAIIIARDSARDIDRDIDRAIASARDIDRAIASARDITSARDSAIASAIASASFFVAIFSNPKFAELPNQLERMAKTVPNNHASSEAWRNWADELEALWLNALNLTQEDLTFSLAEVKALRDYLYTTELLLKCKDAAIRIPKQAWAELEDRLLTYRS